MTAPTILADLRSSGFSLRLATGELKVAPFSKLTAEQLALLREHKAAIVAHLVEEEREARRPFRRCGWCGMPTPGKAFIYCVRCGKAIADAIEAGTAAQEVVGKP